MMMTLFPHYQSVGRSRLNLGFDSLVPWIVAQNLGVAVFSLPAGWLADRYGNRIVLKVLMGGLCLVPGLALYLSGQGAWGAAAYFIVFGLLGLTPVTIRTFSNYTLELVEREHHPRYLSLLSLFMAGPAVLGSLLVGSLIDRWGFEPAFYTITATQVLGFLICFALVEPRAAK
ncbi:MAG: MFS transporter [Pirellulaceae bacterium]